MGRLLRTITSETQALTRHVTPVEGIAEGPPLEPTWLDDMVSRLTCESANEQGEFIRQSGLDDPNGWDKAVDDQFW